MSRYRLTGRLEEGELSELYAAVRDEDEAVVIKLFHARNSDVRYGKELAETARLLAQAKGPGILRFLEMGLAKDRLAVVRQAADGPTLGQVLQRLTTKEYILPPPVALSIVVQILETVQLAHEAGVIHGALTPGNITLTSAGTPAIFDFGALKALQAVPGLKKSFAGRGRDAYRAPEVVKGSTPTIESDVYSAGAILYELLTLREPVGDRTGTMSVRTASLPSPSRVDRRLNSRLDPIVLRSMELVEARRFRSAAEFALAIRNFLANNGGLPQPEETRRLLEPMRIRESTFNLGPVPFAEPFTLKEIRGADLPPVTDKTQVVGPRSAFSGPGALAASEPPGGHADTDKGPPAFEPERDTARSSLVTDPAETAPMRSSRIAAAISAAPAGMAEPKFDEGTDPGQAGPLEKGWDAPSGIAPPKPRAAKNAPAPAAAVLASRPVLRNPRVKLVEDFSQPPTEAGTPVDGPTDLGEPEKTGSDPLTPALLGDGAPLPTPPPPRSSGPKGLLPPPRDMKGIEITGPLEYAAAPAPDTNQSVPKALNTSERFLANDARRRRAMLLVSLGLAAVGALSFALAVRKFGASRQEQAHEEVRPPRDSTAPSEPYDPAYRTVNGALKKYFGNENPGEEAAPGPPPGGEPKSAERPADAPSEDVLHKPAPKDRAAFLTLSSDVSAVVYIDDLRVKKKTPLLRYPVEPGLRHILLEAPSGERRALDVELERGQVKKLDERFKAPRGR